MLLSLRILEDWLKEYSPEPHIKEGNRTISTVRIIADDLNMSTSTVYLNQISSQKILCSNGPDYLVLNCDDINVVLNSVLDAFEYYNDWSNGLSAKIKEGCSLEEVLKEGYQLTKRYLILADPTFLIYETYGPEDLISRFPEYKKAVRDQMLPLNVLLTINRDLKIRTPGIPSYEVAVSSMQINTIVSNLFSYSTHNGWLITNNLTGDYSEGDKDLQDAFADELQTWMALNEASREKTDREQIFRNLLDSGMIAEKDLNRLAVFHWMPDDEKQIYVISKSPDAESPFFALVRSIERSNPSGFVFLYGENLIYIRNCTLNDIPEHDQHLEKLLETTQCSAGISPRFEHLSDLRKNYDAAKAAAEYAVEKGQRIIESKQILLSYLSSLIKENSAIPILHPDIEALKQYDRTHNTFLCETLRVFLKNKCSYEKTKNDLFIHRSTLLYRIERIREMTSFDPDNYEDCLLMEICFLLET